MNPISEDRYASNEEEVVTNPLVGRDILCFSHDWSGDPLSKTHLMRLLARNNRVLWVNSIGYRTPTVSGRDLRRVFHKLAAAASPMRELEPNIFVLNPLLIPAWGSSSIRKINVTLLGMQVRAAMRKLHFHRAINWIFNPAAGIIAGHLGEDKIIYHCVDESTALLGVHAEFLMEIERDLLDRADLVIVSAQKLQESKKSAHAPTVLVRHGVDYDHFHNAVDPSITIPDSIANLPKPIIGYFGLISEDWVDLPLLLQVARSFPQASLVMLGKVAMDISSLRSQPNVHFLGRQPYASLPNFCRGFDVAIIPFPVTELTLHANPLKTREYLAAGLPVVSTPIPEVEILNQCLIGTTPAEFVDRIEEALEAPGPSVHRSESMQSESWAARLEEIRGLIQLAWGPQDGKRSEC